MAAVSFDDELTVRRFFVGIAGDDGEEGPSEGESAGEVPRAATAPLKRQEAARQLPGAHAEAAGEQPACLALWRRRPCPFGLGRLCWARWAR